MEDAPGYSRANFPFVFLLCRREEQHQLFCKDDDNEQHRFHNYLGVEPLCSCACVECGQFSVADFC